MVVHFYSCVQRAPYLALASTTLPAHLLNPALTVSTMAPTHPVDAPRCSGNVSDSETYMCMYFKKHSKGTKAKAKGCHTSGHSQHRDWSGNMVPTTGEDIEQIINKWTTYILAQTKAHHH